MKVARIMILKIFAPDVHISLDFFTGLTETYR